MSRDRGRLVNLSVKFRSAATDGEHGEEYASLMSMDNSDENDIEGDKSEISESDTVTDSDEVIERGRCCPGLYDVRVFLLLICLFSIVHGKYNPHTCTCKHQYSKHLL